MSLALGSRRLEAAVRVRCPACWTSVPIAVPPVVSLFARPKVGPNISQPGGERH